MRILPAAGALALALGIVLAPSQAFARPTAIGQLPTKADMRSWTVEGMVTADLRSSVGGVLLQDAGDGNRESPDVVFVRTDTTAPLATGTWLRVQGQLMPSNDPDAPAATVLRAEQVEPLQGREALSPVLLSAPPAHWRALRGAWVRIEAPLTLTATDRLQRNGELGAAFDGRLWQPSEVAVPGSAGHEQVTADNRQRGLRLRAGTGTDLLPDSATLRTGMQLAGIEGIVAYRENAGVRLDVTRPLEIPAVQRPAAPRVKGAVKIAAFNLENYFNGDGHGGGFPTPRGARTFVEHQAQTAKLVAAITGLDSDVAALMELENDGFDASSSIAELVAALNAARGGTAWRFVDAGAGPGDNMVRVGIVYRSDRVTPVGRPAVLEEGPFGERSRVPLAQAFRAGRSAPFVVVANHFKSKGCSEATGEDLDQKDGQACWNATRVQSARLLHAWLQRDPTGSGSHDVVLLGDFNAYAMEAPIRTLVAEGWRDALAVARVEQPYSYVYNGQSGRLDHALLSPGMAARLRGAAEWHINADEQDDAGYQGRNDPGPWRSSDHDPLLLGID